LPGASVRRDFEHSHKKAKEKRKGKLCSRAM
jgi:hypothetical protein